ncbi:hypothetical protein EV127DRAFT_415653 [Xylaria flabelliformis]|nr:hypothetical protein EV127DRAFT_415653 [Xylaria flabelliformis]
MAYRAMCCDSRLMAWTTALTAYAQCIDSPQVGCADDGGRPSLRPRARLCFSFSLTMFPRSSVLPTYQVTAAVPEST